MDGYDGAVYALNSGQNLGILPEHIASESENTLCTYT